MSQGHRIVRRAALGPRKLLPGALLMLVCAAALAACGGDDLAPGQVARVGDATIEREEFDHWLQTAASSQQSMLAPEGATQEVVVPDPPDFNECVAAREEQAQAAAEQAQPPEGGVAPPEPQVPSAEELRSQCEEEYDLLKEQVMQFLVQAEAIQQEADERGIAVPDEEVQTQLDDLTEQSFPDDAGFQEFLETSGMTEEDLLFRVRLDLLISEIRSEVLAEEGDVTEEEIVEYYEANRNEPPIGQPEQREVQVVVTDNERQAQEARDAIEDGDPFAEVAEEFSIDPASSDRGGKLTVQQGSEEAAFDEAVFAAEEGELMGPIESELGWYVFEVTDVQAASEQTLEESREAIVQVLMSQTEEEALGNFQEEFAQESREMTVCAEDFVIPGCSNGPELDEAPQPGVPEGAPPPPPPGAAPQAPPGAAPQAPPPPPPGAAPQAPPGAAPQAPPTPPPDGIQPSPPPGGAGGGGGGGGQSGG